jgi:hypothetical protein
MNTCKQSSSHDCFSGHKMATRFTSECEDGATLIASSQNALALVLLYVACGGTHQRDDRAPTECGRFRKIMQFFHLAIGSYGCRCAGYRTR